MELTAQIIGFVAVLLVSLYCIIAGGISWWAATAWGGSVKQGAAIFVPVMLLGVALLYLSYRLAPFTITTS